MNQFKRSIYGTIPYYLSKVFRRDSPAIKYYEYIKTYGYSRHLYLFKHEYDNLEVCPILDVSNGLYYIFHNDKKLYFRRNLDVYKIKRLYLTLLMEQDVRSAHRYYDSLEQVKNKTFVDIGASEGIVALNVIESVNKIYLFECDEDWVEALNATFAPWKEKVCIINKYISNKNDGYFQSLDSFFEDKPKDNLFLKMDIEGEERKALSGAEKLFTESQNLEFAICAYHLNDDEQVISSILDKYHCLYNIQRGFFRKRIRAVVFRSK